MPGQWARTAARKGNALRNNLLCLEFSPLNGVDNCQFGSPRGDFHSLRKMLMTIAS